MSTLAHVLSSMEAGPAASAHQTVFVRSADVFVEALDWAEESEPIAGMIHTLDSTKRARAWW
jgi:hypothetical protein